MYVFSIHVVLSGEDSLLFPLAGTSSRSSRHYLPWDPCMVDLPTFGIIWLTSMVNVGKYTIHGSYGSGNHLISDICLN